MVGKCSGEVLDSRPRGPGFESGGGEGVVFLLLLLSFIIIILISSLFHHRIVFCEYLLE